MSEKKASGALAIARTVGELVAAWGLVFGAVWADHHHFHLAMWDTVNRILSGFPALAYVAGRFLEISIGLLGVSYFTALVLATGLAPLGFATRMVARAGIRAGHADFLDAVRAWAAKHPRATKALLATPAVLFSAFVLWPRHLHFLVREDDWLELAVFPQLLAAWLMSKLTRRGVDALLAPTLDRDEESSHMEIRDDEIAFDAVAVTRETQAAVAALMALTLGVVGWIASRPILLLFQSRLPLEVIVGYLVAAATSAVAFQKASRVAVGVDGVLVKGTSRTRFFPYRDLDTARVVNGDLELVRKGRVVLRLQLHGADASRREAVLARVVQHIDRVRGGKDAMAAQLVATATPEHLTRVASGGADYRAASVSREALWALVEGPSVDGEARRAAAEAIVKAGGAAERARVRVAAERVAAPEVREAMEQLATGDEERAAGRRASV